MDILPDVGTVQRARVLLTTHPAYNDLSPSQYSTALTWLRELDLLNNVDSTSSPTANRILGGILEKIGLPWLRDADALIQGPDELPGDILAAGNALGLDGEGIYSQVVSSWGKVDTAIRERVGAAGELALVSMLREHTSGRVEHVSTWSDGFGFDVAYIYGDINAHLEVKSTTRSGRFTAYLSRHEYEVMVRDQDWILVAVRLNHELEVQGVGHVPTPWIEKNLPRDLGPYGSWASCKLEVPPDIIQDGVPRICTLDGADLPPWHVASK